MSPTQRKTVPQVQINERPWKYNIAEVVNTIKIIRIMGSFLLFTVRK